MQVEPRATRVPEQAVQVSELLQVVQESSKVRQAYNQYYSFYSIQFKNFTGTEATTVESS